MPKLTIGYPDFYTAEGLRIAATLPRMKPVERELVARDYFKHFIEDLNVVHLPAPRALTDNDSCVYLCDGAVRYVQAYSVRHDQFLGRMDLCFEDAT